MKHKSTNAEFIEAVRDSTSLSQALFKLGINKGGGNHQTAKNRIKSLNLDTSHFKGHGWSKGLSIPPTKWIELEDILVLDSNYQNTSRLKKRLIKAGILQEKCYICGITEWMKLPAPLELDHINGDRRNNRKENLRLLCPNCHAQTSNYRGKNIKRA